MDVTRNTKRFYHRNYTNGFKKDAKRDASKTRRRFLKRELIKFRKIASYR
jgi:hypothetical protein